MKTFKEFFQIGVTKPSTFDVQNYLNQLGTRLMQLSDIKRKIISHFKNIKNLRLDPSGRKVLSFGNNSHGFRLFFAPSLYQRLRKGDIEPNYGPGLNGTFSASYNYCLA